MNIRFADAKIGEFIEGLPSHVRAKTFRTLNFLERFGYQLGMPHSKQIERHIFELRVRGKQDVRIFYTTRSADAILLHGFVKKSMKIPARELEVARRKLGALDSI